MNARSTILENMKDRIDPISPAAAMAGLDRNDFSEIKKMINENLIREVHIHGYVMYKLTANGSIMSTRHLQLVA